MTLGAFTSLGSRPTVLVQSLRPPSGSSAPSKHLLPPLPSPRCPLCCCLSVNLAPVGPHGSGFVLVMGRSRSAPRPRGPSMCSRCQDSLLTLNNAPLYGFGTFCVSAPDQWFSHGGFKSFSFSFKGAVWESLSTPDPQQPHKADLRPAQSGLSCTSMISAQEQHGFACTSSLCGDIMPNRPLRGYLALHVHEPHQWEELVVHAAAA